MLRREYGSALFLLVMVTVFCMQTFGIPKQLRAGPVDGMVYWEASVKLQDGGEGMYNPAGWETRGMAYIDPPPFAALFAPFTLVDDRPDMDPRERSLLRPYPYPTLIFFWVFLHSVGWALLVWLLGKSLTNDPAARLRIAGVATLAVFGELFLDSVFGNVNIFIALSLLGSWMLLQRGKDLSGGMLLGVAAMIKIMPGMILPVLILQRRWRACGGFALGMFLLWLTPLLVLVPELGLLDGIRQNFALSWQYITELILPMLSSQKYDMGQPFFMLNTSVTAALHRLFGDGVFLLPTVSDENDVGPVLFALPKSLLRVIGTLVPICMYVLAVISAWKWRGDKRASLGLWGLVIMAASSMNVLFWHYHFVAFILPAGVLALEWYEDRSLKRPVLLCIGSLAFICCLLPMAALVRETKGAQRVMVWGLPTLGYLTSWFIAWRLLVRGAARRASAAQVAMITDSTGDTDG